MKILDWFYHKFYCATIKRGHRDERAVFLFWIFSSFIYVAFFYLMLTLMELRIYKVLFLPIWAGVFFGNYFLLTYIYVKNKRAKLVLKAYNKASKSYIITSAILSIIAIFVSLGIAIICVFFYGKNVSFI